MKNSAICVLALPALDSVSMKRREPEVAIVDLRQRGKKPKLGTCDMLVKENHKNPMCCLWEKKSLRLENLQSVIKMSNDDARTGKKDSVNISVTAEGLNLGTKDKQTISSTTTACSSCNGIIMCHCGVENVSSSRTSSSDISSDRSPEEHHGHCGVSRLASVEHGIVLNEESCALLSSTPSPHVSDQMSPKRALRVAMLKSRFATTISKATHQLENLDYVKLKLERERLERKELQGRVEKRESERKAARMALAKMERTVEFNDAFYVLKELEFLSRATLV